MNKRQFYKLLVEKYDLPLEYIRFKVNPIYIWNGNKKLSMGINRNIVECKVLCLSFQTDPHSVLIETSWNVKRYVAVIVAEPVFCINRNIVECKVALSMLPAKAPAY